MPARERLLLAAAAAAALVGCGESDGPVPGSGTVDPGDTLRGQGVEIIDGRFVPDLVTAEPAQAINFVNRDDVIHRIAKVSGPGRDFRSPALAPGERYRLSLAARPGWKLGSGTVVYRSERGGGATGRIEVYGTTVPRRDDRYDYVAEPPQRPDWAARRRARGLAAYVSQCEDFRRCDTPRELVENVGGGSALSFVAGSGRTVVESGVSTHGPEIPLGDGPDEVEVRGSADRFVVVGHSRSGRDFVVAGSERDPDGWTRRWR